MQNLFTSRSFCFFNEMVHIVGVLYEQGLIGLFLGTSNEYLHSISEEGSFDFDFVHLLNGLIDQSVTTFTDSIVQKYM